MLKRNLVLAFLAPVLILGCASAADHRAAVQEPTANDLTVGKVQREIRVGMSGAEVAEVLGSPNIVSTDENRREVWIYDKVSTEFAYSGSSGGVNSLILGVGSAVGGIGGAGYSSSAGASSRTQKTLTIIIKFDEGSKVRDFAYHSSSF